MWTLTDSAPEMSLADYPAPAGKVISGAFDQALETNPVPLFMLSKELYDSRQVGPKMPKEEALQQTKMAGVNVTIPEDGITQSALSLLIERRKDDAARELLFSRKEGFAAGAGMFGAGLAGTLMDPLNVAAGFLPVLGGTRYAAALAEAGTIGSRAAIRLGIGAAEGAVGAAAVELPTINLRRDLQDDYSLYDSLANIAFGTLASAGLRGVGGVSRDAWLGVKRAREIDALHAIPSEVIDRLRAETRLADDRSFFADLEQGFDRGAGIPEELRAQMEGARARQSTRAAIAAANMAIDRRLERFRQEELSKGVEPDEALLKATRREEAERQLLSPAQIAERRFREIDLEEVKRRIERGEGLIVIPKDDREIAAAISSSTHAQALKTAVAQAIEGRQIDVEPVVRQDPIFGSQRMPIEEVRARARSNMSQKVGADKEASDRATVETRGKTEGPQSSTGSPPPAPEAIARPTAIAIDAMKRAREGVSIREKSPELIEAENLLAQTQAQLKALADEAGVKFEASDFAKKADDYERAYRALAECVKGS